MPTLIGDVLEQKETPGRMWRPGREEDGEDGEDGRDGVVGVSKKTIFEIQQVPYLSPFHWSREAQNNFCFCSSSSGRPPSLFLF